MEQDVEQLYAMEVDLSCEEKLEAPQAEQSRDATETQVFCDGDEDVNVDNMETPQQVDSISLEECEDEDDKEPLNYELQQGYRILKEVMSDQNKSLNWPFMNPIDVDQLGLWDYYERVKNPMWLKKSMYSYCLYSFKDYLYYC